ncbi:MAG: phosphoglycerate kinase [Chloroflexi bacterium]|nr:phosphoglycerate kinase [Chloroflexota bacterium]
MKKLTVRDIDVTGKRVFLRVDFNVPLEAKSGAITNDSRIRASLPTIRYLIEHKARVILCSHLGRPDGKVVENLRMKAVAQRLSEILGQPVNVTGDCVGAEAEKAASSLSDGEVLLLENVRFHREEEAGDPAFAGALAKLADIYINDAFGASHRNHASIAGITKFLPSVAGFLLEKEIDTLGGIIENPAHPFAALLGGAKISDKVGMLENIMGKIDFLLIGGGMAATFLKTEAYEVGQSLIEADRLDTAAGLIARARSQGVRLLLPVDVMVAGEISAEAKSTVVPVDRISPDQRIVDIGPETVRQFAGALRHCKTVFWNGPMGIFEIPRFAGGTKAIASELAKLKATTVIGGGSTDEVVTNLGLADKMTFVSTGGGASLEFLGGKKLPGVEALLDKDSAAAAKLRR